MQNNNKLNNKFRITRETMANLVRADWRIVQSMDNLTKEGYRLSLKKKNIYPSW